MIGSVVQQKALMDPWYALYNATLDALTLSQRQISKLKEFADSNFKFNENSRQIFKQIENSVEKDKLLMMSNFSFLHGVFKMHVLQTH